MTKDSRIDVYCANCGMSKKISPSAKRSNNFCNPRCHGEFKIKNPPNQHLKNRIVKQCHTCKKSYEVIKARDHTSNYCSYVCNATSDLRPKSSLWKGDNVGYVTLHMWVYTHKGRPSLCEHCNKTEGKFEWANKSGEYKRELDDWLRLCISCHRRYDNIAAKGWVTRKKNMLI